MYLILLTTFFLLQFPHLVTAQCPACSSYTAALNSCQSKTTSGNLTTTGSTIDTATVDCMCVSSSSTSQMNTCQGCALSSISSTTADNPVDTSLLLSWYYVCKAKDQWGDQQGVACWEGQPLDLLPCVSNTVKKGGGSTSGGSAGSDTAPRSVSCEYATALGFSDVLQFARTGTFASRGDIGHDCIL